MGRTIPSISARIDAKIAQWERFSKHLNQRERDAFSALVSVLRNRRTAIDAADEADLAVAMLLAMIVHLQADRDADNDEKGGLDERAGGEDRQGA